MKFDWQTEDDAKWEEEAAESQPAVKRQRRWTAVLVAVLAFGLTAWLLYRQADRQVKQAEASVAADVAAAYRLVHQAAVQSDRELFESLLAGGRYPAWAESQLALFDHRLIAGLEPLGLHTQLTAPEVVSVTLSPDLTQAELLADWRYSLERGEIVIFRRPARMELVGGRWRLAPIDTRAWGDALTYRGHYLTIYYPTRDRELVTTLAADLSARVEDVCRNVSDGAVCYRSRPQRITLSADESELMGFILSGSHRPSKEGWYHLPTPFLIGMPMDEAGYEVMVRAYTTALVTQMVVNSLDCSCGDRPLYQLALLNRELTRLGLNKRLSDFLLYEPEDVPIALPAEDIQVLCRTNYRGVSDLYRYNLAAGEWTKELSMAGYYTTLNPLPDNNGVMIRQQPVYTGETQPRTLLWRDGEEAVVFRGRYFGAADPAGERALMYDHQGDWSLVENSMFRYRLSLFDLGACETTHNCSGAEVDGFLVWSPDGEHTIIRREGSSLWLGNSEGRPIRSMGLGTNPLWLDEETYAFVNVSRTAIVTATVQVRWRGRLVTLPDLLTAAPGYESGYGLAIGDVAASPADPNLLFVRVSSQPREILPPSQQSSYIFSFNRQTGEVSVRLQYGGNVRFSPLSFSPDGRWLTTSAFHEGDGERYLYVHNVATGQTITVSVYSAYVFPVYHWSAGSDWLALINDGLLQLVAPEYQYQTVVLPEGPGCDSVAWVKQ